MYIRLNFVVSAIHRVSMKSYPVCLSIVRFSYFFTFLTELFFWAMLFLRLKVVLLRLELSIDTTIAAEIGQAVVD